MAEFTKEQLIAQANIMRDSAKIMAEWDVPTGERALAALGIINIVLAVLTATVFMHAITEPDGGAHFAEFCVSAHPEHILKEVELLNDSTCRDAIIAAKGDCR